MVLTDHPPSGLAGCAFAAWPNHSRSWASPMSPCATLRPIRTTFRSTTLAFLPHLERTSRISTNSRERWPWTAPTTERSVNYAELAPGSYRFLVRAVNEDGQASQVPASVTFTILPPVWKRGWFLGTLALLAIGSGYAVHKSRVTRLLEMERLRTRIASDLHDDVGSSLTQISILSEIVRTQLAGPGEPESPTRCRVSARCRGNRSIP